METDSLPLPSILACLGLRWVGRPGKVAPCFGMGCYSPGIGDSTADRGSGCHNPKETGETLPNHPS